MCHVGCCNNDLCRDSCSYSCPTVNTDNTVGAVGFTTRLAPKLYPVMLIRVDEDTGEPIRDRDGMCIQSVARTACTASRYLYICVYNTCFCTLLLR